MNLLLANVVFLYKGLEEMNNRLKSEGKGSIPIPRNQDSWLNGGVGCEILSPNAKGWRKGKIRFRVTVEFCPDEPEFEEAVTSKQVEIKQPESPLDEIRQLVVQDT